jgi:hypothetical protein
MHHINFFAFSFESKIMLKIKPIRLLLEIMKAFPSIKKLRILKEMAADN